jgi:hypothetical protein
MKKIYLSIIFFVLCGFFIFGNDDNREEVDFLLFMPNSGSRFVNEEQAFVQLNKLALYLSNKNLNPGQIIVCGYAAYAPNDIKSVDLSRERALTVMEELQKRGISKELFADPVGYGAVSLWGSNAGENDKKPNRRVRILLDGESPIPVTNEIINVETAPPGAAMRNSDIVEEKPLALEYMSKESNFKFPWWIIPLLAFFLLLFLLHKGRSRKQEQKTEPKNEQAQIPIMENKHKFVHEEAVTTWMVNLDEEIRIRAYELSLERNGTGDYREQDWYNAVHEISAWYTACGHSVFSDGRCWWASRSHSCDSPVAAVS